MRFLIVFLFACGCAGRFSRTDVVMQGGVATVLVLDYLQTRQITVDGLESNPIMGSRGERMPPVVYFPSVLAVHTLVMMLLPGEWRTATQIGTVAVQVKAVRHNRTHGY